MLLGLPGVVLLIACANLANLMLARGSARVRELAVRLSLGATRSRLICQLLWESAPLILLGAATGLALAHTVGNLLVALLSTQGDSLFVDLRADWRVLGFTAILAALTALLFGLVPAFRVSRFGPSEAMRAGSTRMGVVHQGNRLRRVLMISQVALSLVLVTGAVLFARTFANLLTVDTGFREDGILIAGLDLSELRLPVARRQVVKQEILDRIRAIPAVEAASEVGIVPLSGTSVDNRVWAESENRQSGFDPNFNRIGTGYFKTLGTPLLAGRDFDERDTPNSPKVAIVNQEFARQLRKGANPVGLQIRREATPHVQLCLLGIPDLIAGGKRGRVMPEIVDWREPPEIVDWRQPPRRRRLFLLVLAVIAVVVFFGRTALSYYVEALWFGSLGYRDVFRTTLTLQWAVFAAFTAVTFLIVYGWFLALRWACRRDLPSGSTILIGGQPLRLPVDRILRLIGLAVSFVIAAVTGASMMADWSTFALYWYGPPTTGGVVDPIFGKPISFYLFTLPAWQSITGWLLTLAVIACVVAGFFILMTGSARALTGPRGSYISMPWRGFSLAFAFLLLITAMRAYLSRFERLFDDHTIFGGVTYTDAHVMLTGMLVVCAALVVGAAIAAINVVSAPRVRWLLAAIAPAAACYLVLQIAGWYVNSFIVKPNELVRERPFIAYNIELTRQAFGLERLSQREFPAATTVDAADPANNQPTLQNIRLWDWRALQDTLRQIQEIRTYYDFPDIDIDRYEINGTMRQVMLAARELNVDKLPESSRNWINEKLIYTHGYGITMNPVNGFTPEGLPTLILSNMPIQSTVPSIAVTRPEIYFGELTDTDVYVKTRQQEFNYPQGQTNSLTSYEGNGGILVGGFLRRVLIAFDRGDLTKLPFSYDINQQSRLLMRRNVRERVAALAPFLIYDSDPYVVIGDDGRLSWMIDAYTISDSYPYSTHYALGGTPINYMRNSIKVVIDAYDGTTTFYVFDPQDPIIMAYRRIFPALFKDAAAMPPTMRKHVRYPELLLKLQAAAYAVYHMTDPQVFYNREDLWTVASEVGMDESGQQKTLAMEPNFVLMKLPGETNIEFVDILPFTPVNRNNLIGWIAGRSDGAQYGTLIVYDFPKTKLVDGPLQIEARIDQNAQLSGQLTLWNQQGSHVRRGTLLVIPCGRALLYAEPIYLQAERSPMPELRLVVLALQDRLAYGPTFESAMGALFAGEASSLNAPASPVQPERNAPAPAAATTPTAADLSTLITGAAKDLADYQKLTAEGKLGEAGQKLEQLKRKLDELNARQK